MARARNIKPGFFTNEYIAELSPFAQLLFIGLWTLADRKGRLEDRPKGIRGKLFPYGDQDVNALLNELAESPESFIIRYEVNGKRYIQITNFEKHQNPHKNEVSSNIPAPPEISRLIEKLPEQYGTTPADSLLLDPDSLSFDSLVPETIEGGTESEIKDGTRYRTPEDPAPEPENLKTEASADAEPPVSLSTPAEKSSKVAKAKKSNSNGYTPEFEEFWLYYPRKIDKQDAFNKWRAILKEGEFDADMLIISARNYAIYVQNNENANKYIKHATTFFNKQSFRDFIDPPEELLRPPPLKKQQGEDVGDFNRRFVAAKMAEIERSEQNDGHGDTSVIDDIEYEFFQADG